MGPRLILRTRTGSRPWSKKRWQRFGRIDVLYNNAGVILGKPFQETTLEEWERIIRIDLTGPFLMSQAVVAHMEQQHSGSIINISSAGGILGYPQMSAYGAAKGGLVNLTRCMAVDLARV